MVGIHQQVGLAAVERVVIAVCAPAASKEWGAEGHLVVVGGGAQAALPSVDATSASSPAQLSTHWPASWQTPPLQGGIEVAASWGRLLQFVVQEPQVLEVVKTLVSQPV